DWLHSICFSGSASCVADWSQTGIGYTEIEIRNRPSHVADWSQTGIGYTPWLVKPSRASVADWSQTGIGYTVAPTFGRCSVLRIGRRLGLVTLDDGAEADIIELRI